ncbi:MAG: lysoplasmalogenase family protein, partial [Candidatus Hodarchaeales archaeon]
CVFLSGMFLSTFLLWMSSGVMELGIVVLGGLLFVISDSFIAIREFHHQINYSTLKVMTTYYSAIFLLSLASLIQFS